LCFSQKTYGLNKEMQQICPKAGLPHTDGRYWECEKDEPTLGDTCRMECENDQVVEKETLQVCTTLGWGPKKASSTTFLCS